MSKTFPRKTYPPEKNVFIQQTIPSSIIDNIRTLTNAGEYGKLEEFLINYPVKLNFSENKLTSNSTCIHNLLCKVKILLKSFFLQYRLNNLPIDIFPCLCQSKTVSSTLYCLMFKNTYSGFSKLTRLFLPISSTINKLFCVFVLFVNNPTSKFTSQAFSTLFSKITSSFFLINSLNLTSAFFSVEYDLIIFLFILFLNKTIK